MGLGEGQHQNKSQLESFRNNHRGISEMYNQKMIKVVNVYWINQRLKKIIVYMWAEITKGMSKKYY